VHSGPAPHDGAADIGPKAIDFYVRAPMQRHYEAVLAAGYVARSPPIVHDVGDMTSEEFVFWGPDGVPILLMVGHRHGPEHLRPGWREGDFSEVATVSVVADDPDASRRFYRELLGLSSLVDTESAPEFREQACRLVGVPPDTRIFWQLYSAPGEPSGKILVLHFVGAGAKRLRGRMRPGHLGFSLLTHRCSDLDGLAARLAAAGVRTWGAPARVEWNGADRRILMVEGPNEELFEFVETRT
jgi:catechol 2,3-dioxygenase-like lactoylglutathione lyase family enzyme